MPLQLMMLVHLILVHVEVRIENERDDHLWLMRGTVEMDDEGDLQRMRNVMMNSNQVTRTRKNGLGK